MELTNIREIFRNKDKFADKEVTIGGWVRSNRNSKNFGFIVVNDGTFFEPIQVVYGNGLDNYDEVGKINVGAAIIVRGTLVLTPDAKQPFEIQAEKVEVFSDLFGRLLFQLYYTIGKWRAADADGISEKRKDSDLGILRSTDDRNHYLQTGTGDAWIICTVLSAADHRYLYAECDAGDVAGTVAECILCDIYAASDFSSAADAADSDKRT